MDKLNELLPPMLYGEELRKKLTNLPPYDPSIIEENEGTRLLQLMDIYKVFLPNDMAIEIYHKLYMMTSMSLAQKNTVSSVKQLNANHQWIHGGEFHGVISGATSASIIGNSGIGKTTCIQYAVQLVGDIIETKEPYRKVIPVVIVNTPFDCNYKGLLCQIVASIDEALGTNYSERTQKAKTNAQTILSLVSQLCHLYIGTLIIDEIQYLLEHKSGKQLYRMILQLINVSGINVLLVGTNECLDFFQQAPQMARRSLGLTYGPLDFDTEFRNLCNTLWSYQYVKNKVPLSEGLVSWLYEHTNGNSASLVSLIHDAQEIAILSGRETLGIETLTRAYNERMKMMHDYIRVGQTKLARPNLQKTEIDTPTVAEEPKTDSLPACSIAEMVATAKDKGIDVVSIMREHFIVVEV